MKNLTETELLNRKRALHAGTVLSKVSIAAAVFLLLSAFASVFVMLFAGLAILLWITLTICLLGIPFLIFGKSWLGLLYTFKNTVEFGSAMVDFMIRLTAPLAAISISCAVLAPVLLFLAAGENKSAAVPRTVVSAIVVLVSVLCIIFAGGVK